MILWLVMAFVAGYAASSFVTVWWVLAPIRKPRHRRRCEAAGHVRIVRVPYDQDA